MLRPHPERQFPHHSGEGAHHLDGAAALGVREAGHLQNQLNRRQHGSVVLAEHPVAASVQLVDAHVDLAVVVVDVLLPFSLVLQVAGVLCRPDGRWYRL